MKLLMITRKVDRSDGLAGFSYNWVKKLAGNLDKLYVICLEKGEIAGLPDNVEIYSLGKENGKNRWQEFWNFQKFAKKIVPQVDGVFAHQNPEYGILIAPWTKIYHKKLVAWYTHKTITWKLRLLNFLADLMVTASQESFRLASNKLKILHHGIDTEIFSYQPKPQDEELQLLTIGRISRTKNIDLMIDLVAGLKNEKASLTIVGEPILPEGRSYLAELEAKINRLGLNEQIKFLGSIPNYKTPASYQAADIFLNFSHTGSLDKTVLEAMSCGTLVLTSNQAFDFLPAENFLNSEDPKIMIDKLNKLADLSGVQRNQSSLALRQIVIDKHDLKSLCDQIVQVFGPET